MDTALFRWINAWPEGLTPMFRFFSEATKEPGGRIFLGLILLGCLIHPRTRGAAFLALTAIGIANTCTNVLKEAFQMPRPCVELGDVHMRVGKLTSFGTASAHSANMAAIAMVFAMRFKWWGTPWVLAALLTGLSRIYVGVHYPYQVALGWIVGAFCAYVVLESWRAYERIRSKEPSEASVDPG